jgi:hypothetical protein
MLINSALAFLFYLSQKFFSDARPNLIPKVSVFYTSKPEENLPALGGGGAVSMINMCSS